MTNHLTGLIRAAVRLGRTDEAALARRELAEMAASDPAKADLDARLAAVLGGKESPKNAADRIALAFRAYQKKLYASSVYLYTETLASDPKLAEDRKTRHRYNAACAAALAASGQSKDEPQPDAAAAAKLRGKARDWLKAELAAWAKVLDTGPAQLKAVVPRTLEHWKTDSDLAGIRDERELARLSDTELRGVQAALERRRSLAQECRCKPVTRYPGLRGRPAHDRRKSWRFHRAGLIKLRSTCLVERV